MKKYLAALLVALLSFPIAPARAALTEPDRALFSRNWLVNPGAEASTAGLTASTSAHLTTTTAAANVASGNAAFVWSPTAGGETLTFGLIGLTSGGGLAGQAGTLSCKFKSANAIQTHTLAGWDGSAAYNATAIAPTAGSFGRGTLANFSFPTSGSYTMQITSGAADTLYIDDCYMGAAEGSPGSVQGYAGSNWKPDTTLSTNLSAANTSFFSRRAGDSEEVLLTITSISSAAGASALIALPFSIDTSKLPVATNQTMLGTWTSGNSSGVPIYPTNGEAGVVFFDGSDTTHVYLAYQQNTNYSKVNASTITSAAGTMSVRFTVPVAGWDSNVQVAPSTTYKISSYLANGTRVTGSAPTALGQYRSYLRNAGAVTYTETGGTPSSAPSVADGIKIWNASYGSGDSSGQPSKFDIFIGKNKNVTFQSYANSGRTGAADFTPNFSGSFYFGLTHAYDPTTGIVTITGANGSGSTGGAAVGVNDFGSVINPGWTDIIVSDNALAVGMDSQQVISNAKNQRVESMSIATACSSSPCTPTTQSGSWINSSSLVTRNATGNYTLNFSTGYFSGPASCTCTATNSAGSICTGLSAATSTTWNVQTESNSGGTWTGADYPFSVICMGPR